jgi:hypothetical protein
MAFSTAIQHWWEVSPGRTDFHHHLGAGVLTVKAFNASKIYLGPPLNHCMQVRTFLSHAYAYGSIMFIYFIFYLEKFFGCTQLISLFLLWNLVDLLLAALAKTKHAAVYTPITVTGPIIILDHAHNKWVKYIDMVLIWWTNHHHTMAKFDTVV